MNILAGLEAVAPDAPPDVRAALEARKDQMIALGVDSDKRWAALLGQCAHESGGFRRRIEALGYSAERLMVVWPRWFRSLSFARAYEYQPEKLANYIYGIKKADDLGNIRAEDGYAFRGRGWIQITGRWNYTAAAQALDIDLVTHPKQAAEPETAFLIACWFLRTFKYRGSSALWWADQGNLEAVTRIINPALHGLEDRREKTSRALLAISAETPEDRPTLQLNDFNAAVVSMKEMLARLHFDPGPLDEWFDEKTQSALIAFQHSAGLEPDGLCGPATWAALDAAIAALAA